MTTATTPSKRNLAQTGDDDLFPRPFGNYILLMPFARGGMGEVYLAKRGAILGAEKYCVLKKLRPELTEDREYVARFIDEARVVVQLNHANICQVFDVGRVGTEYYLAMEYVSGRDVRSVHDRARSLSLKVNEPSVLHLLAETLAALDYAHRRTHPMTGEPLNLVHRDVSPQNVMVSFEGEVKLIDFGLASSRLKVERTQPNIVMGKMAYMAPEQARGDGIDKRADLFAAAVVGYELMVGERFYEGMSSQEIWYVVGRGGFVPQKWELLSPDFARILAKALHPEPDSRYPSCADFRDAIMGYLHTRHPGLGERSLRELIADLYAEEILRERDMLLGFAEVSGEVVSDLLENTKSQSISLAAAADLLDPPSTGARVVHDERTQGGQDSRASSAAPTTQIVEIFTEATGSGPEGIPEEHTLLEGTQLGGARGERTTTPPTGTIARDLADEVEKTSLGFEPSQRTHLQGDQSAEQTARFQRSPFGEVRTLSVALEDERKGRRGTLLVAAAALLLVVVGVAALTLLDDEGPATALAASSSGEPQEDDALALPGVEGAGDDDKPAEVDVEAPAAAGSAAENGADSAQEPRPATGPEEQPEQAQPTVAAAHASAHQRPAGEPKKLAADEEKARAKQQQQQREAAKRAAADEKAKKLKEQQQRDAAKRAAADEKARKAKEAKEAKEARRAQARARQQPRESVEQMVSVVGKCGLPSPCAKADMVSGWIKYSSMKPDEKRAFDSNVRSCRKRCASR